MAERIHSLINTLRILAGLPVRQYEFYLHEKGKNSRHNISGLVGTFAECTARKAEVTDRISGNYALRIRPIS